MSTGQAPQRHGATPRSSTVRTPRPAVRRALSDRAATRLVISTRATSGLPSSRGSTDDPRRHRIRQKASAAAAAESQVIRSEAAAVAWGDLNG